MMREMSILMSMRHPNIVGVREVRTTAGAEPRLDFTGVSPQLVSNQCLASAGVEWSVRAARAAFDSAPPVVLPSPFPSIDCLLRW
mgnify:CR=1 FL=1